MQHFICKRQNYLRLIKCLFLIFSLSFSLLSFANKSSTKSQIQTGDGWGVKSDTEVTRKHAKEVLFACRTGPCEHPKGFSIMPSLPDSFSPTPDWARLENGNLTGCKSANVHIVNEVSGTVTDDKGDPLPGVTVVVKGTNRGTNTDVNGKYSLSVEARAILVFSFIGFRTQEITVGAQSSINVQMVADQKQLEEVVVVGYGTQKKVNLTGAVAYVDGSTLEKRVSPNTVSLLQGQLPGLQVVQGSGQPGDEKNQLQIRGMGSYGSSNDPLVLVDGVPGPMPTAENVASVSLLKDAASAAIYGSQAANGVLLVTTRRGKAGYASLNFGVTYSMYEASKLPDLITNSADFMTLWNRAGEHSNSSADDRYKEADIEAYRNAAGDPRYPNTDWMKLIFKNAPVTTYSLTATGGNEKTTYHLNFNYLNEPGVMTGFQFNRFTSRLNVETKINNRIKAGVNAGIEYNTTESAADNVFAQAFSQSPTYGPYLLDGSGKLVKNAFNSVEFKNSANPFIGLTGSNSKSHSFSTILNPYLHLDFTEWLSLDVNASLNAGFSKSKKFTGTVNSYDWFTGKFAQEFTGSGLEVSDGNSLNSLLYSTLQFKKDYKRHTVGVMAGTQIEYSKGESLFASRRDYLSGLTREIDAGGLGGLQNKGNAWELAQVSFFGRGNYSYDDRYLLEVNVRADASSRFAPGHRRGYFPSASFGWRIFQEKFIPKIGPWNEAKVRVAYGKLGNQGINSSYPYQSVMGPSGIYSFDNSTIVSGVALANLVNRKVSWEVTKVLDYGLDLGFFEDQLQVTFDWFEKNTTGIIRNQQVTTETGFSNQAPFINEGEMKNTGFEFSIDYKSKPVKDKFSYGFGWNFQRYKNRVVKFGSPEINPDPYGPKIKKEGIPYYSWYIYEWDGIFQTQQEADASGQSNQPKAGDLRIKDISGPAGVPDGVVDELDKKVMDGVFPEFSTGFTVTAAYKDFDLYAFFFASVGQKVYVYGRGFEPFYQGSVPTKDWLNSWTPENRSQTLPAAYNSQRYNSTWTTYPNSWYLKDASFGRLKSLNIGWTYALNRGIRSARIFIAGENLFTLTNYEGLDPERTGGGDFLTYPQNRIYSIGAVLKF